MCGGVKEFESLRAPAPQRISLLHEEIRHYENGELSNIDDSLCYVPRMKLSNPRDQIIKTRHEVVVEGAEPAGLAIVAAMVDSELVQSVPATMPDHFSTNPDQKHISVQQSQSRAPAARAGLMVKPAGRQPADGRRGYGSSSVSMPMSSCSRKFEEKSRRKSVFCSAFSPPKDVYMDSGAPSANFMGNCFLCKRALGSGMDIYMYRGDRAFCSNECRCQHIVEDELSERLQQQSVAERAHCNDRLASSPSPSIPVLG